VAKSFDFIPKDVKKIETKNRRIMTKIPVPESLEIIEELRKYEPRSMTGQPLVVWDKAKGFNVYDKFGNKWIDFSSGVVVTSAGHCNPEVKKAIIEQAEHGLLFNYCFPSEIRAKLVKKLIEITPEPLNKCFLLTTGSEATECAIKLARTQGQKIGGKEKIKIITFDDAFHGRTLGAQQAGGSPKAKEWIVNLDPDINQVPYPNSFKYSWADVNDPTYSDEECFNKFLFYLREKNIEPTQIAGIMSETFQGGWVELMPPGFAKKLREFCGQFNIVLIFDEIQAGFGRTGKLFGFEHYGIIPDLICCGKGISSGMPLSAVIGKEEIMNLYGPNEMTSTHTGNPICAAAALANINYILNNNLVERAAILGKKCEEALEKLQKKYPNVIGHIRGIGLVWGIIIVKDGTKEINPDLAHDIVRISMENGLLFFAPIGSGATIKVCPPLVINEEALKEGLEVFEQVIAKAISG
jgi:4-aminobutyrate aminotransferase/diaminobutyrate-pyruvate transaminase/4-aminobutyrate aminotransferase/(S)-3-amino-2-methylpropionate transaminase